MTDVAKAAGVSQSTVSLALNDVRDISLSEETRQRVRDTAERLGYQLPSTRAKAGAERGPASRRAGHSPLILYVVDEISTSPHPVVSVDGASDAAWQQGATVAVTTLRSDSARESAALDSLLSHPAIVGVIYSTIFTRQVQVPDRLAAVPTVLLNCYEAALPAPPSPGRRPAGEPPLPTSPRSCVLPAEVAGGHSATEHLIEAGHRRIAFINGESWMDAARDRLKGYRRALASHDLPFEPALVREGDWQVGSGYEATLALMRQPRPPTAIFCANDLMAAGSLEALRQLRLAVPREVSVMGYDDQEIAQHTHPALTTLVLPNYEMGRLAVETLLDEHGQAASRHRTLKVEGRLVVRDSVGPPGRKR
ncbi:LacI family DNA-binding transcriptional regulator [Eleftheria terrae]|uniref:LacI family DNA-binding transcriptional regulator n=1 Tax=Eleftheria terrae TaxID=1597781 RepID=UPI00263AAAA9|nr:LacI family DNA-binding transcriptional regulator [Eleftheria terrae]WKB55747.1 LacI family DNA-binding transcriptional regulator [Eleftheria terrae]